MSSTPQSDSGTLSPGSDDRSLTMVVRDKLSFDFESDIPRYWFKNDPLHTRFADAMSIMLPLGERFVMDCVREQRDRVADDKALAGEVDRFIRQEASHSLQHRKDQQRLKKQGLDVDGIVTEQALITKRMHRLLPPAFKMSMAAAMEHVTCAVSVAFVMQRELHEQCDPRMLSFYVWHFMEEVEHRDVCFDLFCASTGGGYFLRISGLLFAMPFLGFAALRLMDRLLKADGHDRKARLALWGSSFSKFFGAQGTFRPAAGPILAYFKPGFDPRQLMVPSNYAAWAQEMAISGSPALAATASFPGAR
ncbi:MAG: metal-dependent hydrolase [Rubrivivax sp.]|nr:MAG: metal-dependent hydrolase [Rubrivivax sp.]